MRATCVLPNDLPECNSSLASPRNSQAEPPAPEYNPDVARGLKELIRSIGQAQASFPASIAELIAEPSSSTAPALAAPLLAQVPVPRQVRRNNRLRRANEERRLVDAYADHRALYARLEAGEDATEEEEAKVLGIIHRRGRGSDASRDQHRMRLERAINPPVHIARRRTWGGSNRIHPDVREHYTLGQQAALSIALAEIEKTGVLEKTAKQLGDAAGCCVRVVRQMYEIAKKLGHLTVQEAPRLAGKNGPSIVRIACAKLAAWVRNRSSWRSKNDQPKPAKPPMADDQNSGCTQVPGIKMVARASPLDVSAPASIGELCQSLVPT